MGNCIASRKSHVDEVDGSVHSSTNAYIGETAAASDGVKVFKLADLKTATRNFRADTVLGDGISSVVYQGWIDGETFAPCKAGFGIPVAVKRIVHLDTSRLPDEWQAEVKFLGEISHPNVVKPWQIAFSGVRGSKPLSWEIRMKIAIDAAGGLAFLHSLERGGVDHDFKTSSILLDKNFNAKVSDSGLADLRSTTLTPPMSPPIRGYGSFSPSTYGYVAPEYVAAGRLTSKSNVYGFGVVLSELLTGLRTVDRNWSAGDWFKPLSNRRNVKKIMDSRLGDKYPLNAALKVSQLVSQCLEANPETRPSMEEVLQALLKIRDHGKSQTAGKT